ncbi:hypothetical protein GCM10010307_56340 [Streptomyces vastus]|uniref:DUF4333 domain-containing protein n=1 Tax=Streptomyces vastus TaxID=285451 RepID=A0ABN3RBQ7_9ACTN
MATRSSRRVSATATVRPVAGATLTCTGTDGDGKAVDIPVTVVKASDRSVTWKFER